MTRIKPSLIGGIAAVMVIGAAAVAAIVPRVSSGSDGPREIRLVARGMTYYLEGQLEPNPTLHVRRGERVRIVLRNDDRGISHDFAVAAWKAYTSLITGIGEAAMEFRAPDTAGEEAYRCTPHGEMMRGTIKVE